MRSSGRKGLLAASSVALLVACAQVAEVAGSTDEGGVHLALAPGKAAVNLPADLAYPGLPGEAITLHYQVVGDEGASKGQLPQSVRAEAGSRIVVSGGQRLQLYLEGGKWATQLVDVTVPPGITTLAPFRWSPAATLEGRLVVSGEPVDFTGVQVRPDNTPRLGWSNAAGAFRMTGLPSVPIRIRAMGPGLEGSQDWRPDDQASARFEIRLVPARIDLERVEPAFGLAGDQVRLFFAGSPAAEVSVHFTGADLAKAWRGADGSWRAVVPKGARSGPVRLLQRGLAGNAVTWHRLAELRFVNVPRVVAREGSWQPEVEAVSDDGRSWPSQDAVMSMQRLSTGLFDLLVAEARLGSMKATASVVLDEATIRRVAPLPPGVVPYALAVAPDGGWLVADHPGRRVLHRPPAGDWSILPWVVDHPRVLATGVDGVVHVLGRKGPGLDVLQRFRWLPPFLPAESTGETVATGDIDAMTIHPVSGVLWSESGRVRDQTGRLWLELPPGSRVESMASGRGGLAVAGAGQIWIMKPDETVWKVVNRSVERLPSTALRALAWDATQLLLAEHARGRVWSWTEEASFRLLAGALDVQVKDPLPVQGEIPALSADIGAPTALLPLGGGRILLADALSASLLEWQP